MPPAGAPAGDLLLLLLGHPASPPLGSTACTPASSATARTSVSSRAASAARVATSWSHASFFVDQPPWPPEAALTSGGAVVESPPSLGGTACFLRRAEWCAATTRAVLQRAAGRRNMPAPTPPRAQRSFLEGGDTAAGESSSRPQDSYLGAGTAALDSDLDTDGHTVAFSGATPCQKKEGRKEG